MEILRRGGETAFTCSLYIYIVSFGLNTSRFCRFYMKPYICALNLYYLVVLDGTNDQMIDS